MNGTRLDFFPTAIWYFDIKDFQSLNHTLLNEVYLLKEQENKSLGRSSVLGWHSHNQLHELNVFEELNKIIINNITEIAKFEKVNLALYKINISQCWAIINSKYAYNTLHNHPNSFYSGVYYLKIPNNNCGNLVFRDPREVACTLNLAVTEYTMWTAHNVTYQPKEGRMIIFPSWLLHRVESNLSEEDRVSISFNISFHPIGVNSIK